MREPPLSAALCAAALLASLTGCPSQVEDLRQLDRFDQGSNPLVDVLWVVEDTAGMAEEQTQLAADINAMLGPMNDLGADWRMGVLSTDMSDPYRRGRALGPPIIPPADQAALDFASQVRIGEDGGLGRGLAAAWSAMTPPLATHDNSGVLRPDARMAVIVLSNSDDCSDDGTLPEDNTASCVSNPQYLVPTPNYVDAFAGLRENPLDVQLHAIVGLAQAEGEGCGTSNPGSRYMQVARGSGGTVHDICGSGTVLLDYNAALAEIGREVAGRRRSFPLSRRAQGRSLRVRLTSTPGESEPLGDGESVERDDTMENGWSFDEASNTVSFWGDALPPIGTTVLVDYAVQMASNSASE